MQQPRHILQLLPLPAGDGPAAQLLLWELQFKPCFSWSSWKEDGDSEFALINALLSAGPKAGLADLAVEEVLVARPGVLWPGLVQIPCYCLGSAKSLPWAQEPVEKWAGF